MIKGQLAKWGLPAVVDASRLCPVIVPAETQPWRHSACHHFHNLIINSTWTVAGGIKDWFAGQHDCCLRLAMSLHLRIDNIVSNIDKRSCACMHMFNANIIHNCMHLKLRDFLKNKPPLTTVVLMNFIRSTLQDLQERMV